MGCNCKSTGKGVPNRTNQKWLIEQVYDAYQTEIGDKTVQYFTTEQRDKVLEWYYEIWYNSKPVDYKTANAELLKVFDKLWNKEKGDHEQQSNDW